VDAAVDVQQRILRGVLRRPGTRSDDEADSPHDKGLQLPQQLVRCGRLAGTRAPRQIHDVGCDRHDHKLKSAITLKRLGSTA
jgi:hypothetical protein